MCFHRSSHANLGKADEGPCDECCSTRDIEKVGEDFSGGGGDVEEGDEAEEVGEEDGVDGDSSCSSSGKEGGGTPGFGLGADTAACDVDCRVDR